MDEAEAGAVLLALGPQLTWHNYDADDDACFSEPGLGIYTCACTIKSKPDWMASVKLPKRDLSIRYGYKTLAAAKAACERHHATGVWE